MSDDQQQAEIKVTLLGHKVTLALPGGDPRWTFDEALVAKAVSDGLAPAEIEERLWVGDPHAWLALLRVSLQRAGLVLNEERLRQLPILDIAEEVLARLREVSETAGPPPEPSPSSGRNKEPNGSGSTEDLNLATIPADGGNPDSPATSTGTPTGSAA